MSAPQQINSNTRFMRVPLRTHLGFTLIELLVSLAIVAVLAGVAMPTFSHMRTEQRINAASNAMQSSIALAKSQALRLAQTILIAPAGCASNSQDMAALLAPPTVHAGNGEWHCGWVVAADLNHNKAVDASDGVLRYVAATPGIHMSNNVRTNTLLIEPSGVVSPMQSLQFCPSIDAREVSYARKLVIAVSGRTRTENLRNGNNCSYS